MKKTLVMMALLGGLACAAEPVVYTWNGDSEHSTFYTPANWLLNGETVTVLPGLTEGTSQDILNGSSGWRITDGTGGYIFNIGNGATVDALATPVYYNASTIKLGQNSTLKTSWDFQIKRLEVSEGCSVTGGSGLKIDTMAVIEGQNVTLTSQFPIGEVEGTIEVAKNATLTTAKENKVSVSALNLVRGDWSNNVGASLHVLGSAAASTSTYIGDAGKLTVDGDFTAGALRTDGTKTSLNVGGNLTASSITLDHGWSAGHASVTVQGTTQVTGAVQMNNENVMTLKGKLTVGTSLSLGSKSTFELSNAAASTVETFIAMEADSSISLTGGTQLTVKGVNNAGGVWMKANSMITLDGTSSLTNGSLTVTGGSLKNNQTSEVHFGASGSVSRNITLTDSTLTVSGGSVVDEYILDGGLLKVETATSTRVNALLSATTSMSVSDSSSVAFAAADKQIGVLTLGADATVTLGSANDHAYQLTTSGLVVSGSSGKVNADLVVSTGTMDFTAGYALTMGCGVTIGNDVVVKLDSTMIDSIVAGQYFTIIEGVDASAVTLGQVSFESSDGRDLTGLGLGLETFDAGNGKVDIRVAPEPATATLSLLALAGLCARRKRH